MDYLMEQYQAAEQTKTFLLKWGLKKSHMAKACNLSADVFSKFLNHRLALGRGQLSTVKGYMNEYVRRNG